MSWRTAGPRAAPVGARAAPRIRGFVLVEDVPASWERYGAIERLLDAPPAGLVIHVGGPTDEGFRIVEVWETEQDWLAFADSLRLAMSDLDPAVATRPVTRAFSAAHVVLRELEHGHPTRQRSEVRP